MPYTRRDQPRRDARLQHLEIERGHGKQGCRVVPLGDFGDPFGRGPFWIEDDRCAQTQSCHQAVAERVGEEHLGRGVESVLWSESENSTREIGAGDEGALRVNDRLG